MLLNIDKHSLIAAVTSVLGQNSINIAEMRVYRSYRGGSAVMIIETDQEIFKGLIEQIKKLPEVYSVVGIEAVEI